MHSQDTLSDQKIQVESDCLAASNYILAKGGNP